MILRNFDEIIGVAKVRGRRSIAVARAEDALVLGGLKLAHEEELVDPLLVGDKDRIFHEMEAAGIGEDWRILHVDGDDHLAATEAVAAVRSGEADLLMKGHMQTSALFRAVLDHDNGLPKKGILSHMAFVQVSSYHKIFGTTDGGLNVAPSFEQKVQIVSNTVEVFHKLGYDRPRIGLLSYIEKVKSNDPETEHWRKISEMAKDGEFGEALIEGPLAMDLCLSAQAREVKGIDSEVAANVDAIVAPNITACNASTKALILGGGMGAGVVVGAGVPIVSLSRGDLPKVRLCSIASAIAMLPREAQ